MGEESSGLTGQEAQLPSASQARYRSARTGSRPLTHLFSGHLPLRMSQGTGEAGSREDAMPASPYAVG